MEKDAIIPSSVLSRLLPQPYEAARPSCGALGPRNIMVIDKMEFQKKLLTVFPTLTPPAPSWGEPEIAMAEARADQMNREFHSHVITFCFAGLRC
jgi:hypothetical protein